MYLIAGIDPGINGGIAILDRDGDLLGAYSMPTQPSHTGGLEVDCLDLKHLLDKIPRVYIEQVAAIKGSSPKSAFSFGRNFQAVLSVCQLCLVPYELVPPKVWQAGVLKGKYKGKQSTLALVARLYPKAGITEDGKADAVAIALWGRQNFFAPPLAAS